MKKLLLISFILLMTNCFAATVGYVDISAFTLSYPQSVAYKKQMDNKVAQIKAYATSSQKLIDSQKTNADKIRVGNERMAQLNKMKKEYNDLKTKRDNLVRQKIKEGGNIVLQQKKLEIIVNKSNVVAGGVDVTQDILKAVK